ncbi:hypothetical protein BOC41_32400 [Burkholderia pseudomallei]|nr:hypothetical protein BOC41_32400 [Burkholderia pseudomallei]
MADVRPARGEARARMRWPGSRARRVARRCRCVAAVAHAGQPMVERRVDTGGGSHGQSQSRRGWRQDMKKILVAMLALGVLIGVVAIVSICVAWTLADRLCY